MVDSGCWVNGLISLTDFLINILSLFEDPSCQVQAAIKVHLETCLVKPSSTVATPDLDCCEL